MCVAYNFGVIVAGDIQAAATGTLDERQTLNLRSNDLRIYDQRALYTTQIVALGKHTCQDRKRCLPGSHNGFNISISPKQENDFERKAVFDTDSLAVASMRLEEIASELKSELFGIDAVTVTHRIQGAVIKQHYGAD